MPPKFVSAAGVPIAAVAAVAALNVATAAPAAAAPPQSIGMQCGSANPLFWAPSFTWNINAGSGASEPEGKRGLEPSLLLAGGNDLPYPVSGTSFGPNWYGTQVQLDWHNETTGASGHSTSNQDAWKQNPSIPYNHAFPGVGTVSFTVTIQTGGGWWFVNTQNAVCKGTVSVVPV